MMPLLPDAHTAAGEFLTEYPTANPNQAKEYAESKSNNPAFVKKFIVAFGKIKAQRATFQADVEQIWPSEKD